MIEFRSLCADEIECRVQSCGEKNGKSWCRVLLYKDARCDMNILDEMIGPENWQRDHKELKGNIYCGVGINVNANKMRNSEPLEPLWVWKWDCGAESNTEKEKGEASDSFKRACVNWGIGRELYTKIPINIFELPYKVVKDKVAIDGTFEIEKIEIDKPNNEIIALSLLFVQGKEKKRCFVWTKDKGTLQAKIKEA